MSQSLSRLSIRLYPLLIVLVIIAPVISSAGLSLTLYNHWPWEYVPQFSDEVYYWHQVASVTSAGTGGGYYTVAEVPASVGPFYAWGAFVPLFYGAIGAIFGWGLHSITIINLVALTLAVTALIGLAGAYRQRRPGVLLVLLITLLLFNPLRMYGPSAMLEGLMYALALVMAGVFDRLLRHAEGKQRLSVWAIAAILGFITAVALLRATWALLLIPAVLLINRRRHPLAIAGWLALAGGLGLAAVLLTRATSAFYPYPFTDALAVLRTDLRAGLGLLRQIVQNNLTALLIGSQIVMLQRGQLLILLVGFSIFALVGTLRRWLYAARRRELAVYGWLLAAPLAFVVLVYDTGGFSDYRQLAPFLLLTLALLALRRRWHIVLVISGLMLLGAAPLVDTHQQLLFGSGFSPNVLLAYEDHREQYASVLAFDPAAESWCNTVHFHIDYFWEFGYLLLSVPPGFGLTWTADFGATTEPGQPPLRSGWFIVQDDKIALIERTTPLEFVLPLPVGGLYRNLAAGC